MFDFWNFSFGETVDEIRLTTHRLPLWETVLDKSVFLAWSQGPPINIVKIDKKFQSKNRAVETWKWIFHKKINESNRIDLLTKSVNNTTRAQRSIFNFPVAKNQMYYSSEIRSVLLFVDVFLVETNHALESMRL